MRYQNPTEMKRQCPQSVVLNFSNEHILLRIILSALLFLIAFALPIKSASAQDDMLIGSEYILLDWPGFVTTQANIMKLTGMRTAKAYVESVQWDAMQPTATSPINFTKMDYFVKEFQKVGIIDLIICLKSRSSWASVNYTTDHTPQAKYLPQFNNWVSAVVQRYDGDGVNDMPGLKGPVRYYEIGNELSTYEPEPIANYIAMLKQAYTTLHSAYKGKNELIVSHAAFLMMNVFAKNPTPDQYATAFGTSPIINSNRHGMNDAITLLDNPDYFDAVNIHALAYPEEINQMVSFIEYVIKNKVSAASRQKYIQKPKPILISDTATSPFIAFGPANVCDKSPSAMGLMIYPAVESDRCRVSKYFQNLINQEPVSTKWVQSFSGIDNIEKIIIGAAVQPRTISQNGQNMPILQGVRMINTSFTNDLYYQKAASWAAGTGNSAWSGQMDVLTSEKRVGLYNLKQVIDFIKGYDKVFDLLPPALTKGTSSEGVRMFEVQKPGGVKQWVAWYEASKINLPGEAVPSKVFSFDSGSFVQFNVTPAITNLDSVTKQPIVSSYVLRKDNAGMINMVLTPVPVFVTGSTVATP